ncbi:MAG: hypothetical protein JSU95_09810 [Betaproteobacteria bacterium]|nr:MAG: hypothetical protein JSU95_09810 [Betaproteobacteria bacterium]
MNTSTAHALKRSASSFAGHPALAMAAGFLALLCLAVQVQAGDIEHIDSGSIGAGSFDMYGVSEWFRDRFSEAELKNYQPDEFQIEAHACGCYDRPEPHYPYLLVFFNTPKGDLVGRPDRRGVDTVITRLAVRHGERYCDVDSEEQCYGTFAHPCEFSDFKYGRQLAPYFPTCKVDEPESELTPVRYNSD